MIRTVAVGSITDHRSPTHVSTLERILLAVDGSAASESAVRAVGALIKGGDTDLFVVHLSDDGPPLAISFGPAPMPPRATAPRTEAYVESAVRTLQSLGVRATGAVYKPVNDVGGEIVESARSFACGLIAVGTGGRGRLGSILLGSVARHVIHRADRSVLVAPLSCTVPSAFTRILVAVDGSKYSERAVELAAETAEMAGAEVVVLHVCAPHGPPWMRYDRNSFSDELDPADTAAALVDRMVGGLADRGLTAFPAIRPARGRLAIGHLSADVLEAARQYDCQMVVVGPRSQTGPGLMLGSVAFQLLHSATVPVLIAR